MLPAPWWSKRCNLPHENTTARIVFTREGGFRMRIFVAGASGAIGRALVPLLVAAGHDVAGTTRRPARARTLRELGARPVILDAFDRPAVFAALADERPHAVIHLLTDLAGHDLAGNTRLRIEGTRNLVDAARAADVPRMVAESLAFAYAPGPGLASESAPLDVAAPGSRGVTVAGVAALEAAVSEMPIGVVLRYGTLYGPGTWYAATGDVADQVRHGTLPAGDNVTSFIQVADAAAAAVDALGWPAGPVNIVDDEPAAATVWLPVYAGAIGAPPPPVAAGAARATRGATNAKARHELGWRPRYPSWREGFHTALG